ncbi:methyl-accepting chemotaxis protein [Desulfocurvus sp. DL9XJH121]
MFGCFRRRMGARLTLQVGGVSLVAFTGLAVAMAWWLRTGELEQRGASPVWIFAVFCVLGVVFVSASSALFLRRGVVCRVTALSRAAREVAGGNFNVVFPGGSDDELGGLEAGLRETVARLKTQLGFSEGILRGMTVGCYVCDTRGATTFANKPLLKMLDLDGSPESYNGQPTVNLFGGDPKRETLVQKVMRGRKPLAVPEWKFTSRAGEVGYLCVEAAPLYDLDGELMGAFALITDITEVIEQRGLIEAQNQRIAKAAADAGQVVVNVSSAADELTAQVEEASHGADQQQERTGEVATAMEQMNATVLEVARNSGEVAELADETREKAQEGRTLAEESAAIAENVAGQVEALRASMADLGERAEAVGRIVEVITDIADQTNLLALNAAIEAARAGDAGRGFAVVADEVRKLAERTMGATQEVRDSIGSIQDSARANIVSTDEAAELVSLSREKAQVSGRALAEIVDMVVHTADQVRSIAAAAEEQSATSEQIAGATEQINHIARETAQVMTESAHAVSDLARQAQKLKDIVEEMGAS